jgi:hypothetical protein
MNCKNCYTEYQANFCPNCGQKTIEKHSFKNVFSGVLEIIELERGFFRTFWDIVRRPKEFFEGYLNGKTKPFTNPILFMFSTQSILLFIIFIILSYNDYKDPNNERVIYYIKFFIEVIIFSLIFYKLSINKGQQYINGLIISIYFISTAMTLFELAMLSQMSFYPLILIIPYITYLIFKILIIPKNLLFRIIMSVLLTIVFISLYLISNGIYELIFTVKI